MKLAHLVLAHNNPEQLSRLLQKLAHPDAVVFVHIDAKADLAPFVQATAGSNLHFIKNRVKVYWGGYSMIQATVNSLKEVLKFGTSFDYIQLLSGQDFPVRPISEFHEQLAKKPGFGYLSFLSVYDEWKEAIPRITRYHLVNFNFPGMYRVESLINNILPTRTIPGDMQAVGRSQWFTIPPDMAEYMIDFLEKSKAFRRFFKYSWAPDEMIFQTILYNSTFRDRMINDNLLYVDWSQGLASPKNLTMEDRDKIVNSGKFFARKFNPEVDQTVIDFFDAKTKNR